MHTLKHKTVQFDLVILMLGTNDLKSYFNLQASDIAKGAMQLCQDISVSKSGPSGAAPEILLVAPATIKWLPEMTATDFEDAMEKSEKLAESFATAARNRIYGCHALRRHTTG